MLRLVPAPQVQAEERAGQGQVFDDLHGAGGENAADAVELAQVPVLVQLPQQGDGVALVEAQLPGVVPAVGVQSPGPWHLRGTRNSPCSSSHTRRIPQKHSSLMGKKNAEV